MIFARASVNEPSRGYSRTNFLDIARRVAIPVSKGTVAGDALSFESYFKNSATLPAVGVKVRVNPKVPEQPINLGCRAMNRPCLQGTLQIAIPADILLVDPQMTACHG